MQQRSKDTKRKPEQAETAEIRKPSHAAARRSEVEGTLPTELGGLSSLQYLYLDNNQVCGACGGRGEGEGLEVPHASFALLEKRSNGSSIETWMATCLAPWLFAKRLSTGTLSDHLHLPSQ